MKLRKLKEIISEKDFDTFIARQNAEYLSETKAATAVIITTDETILLCPRLELDHAEQESKIRDIRAYNKLKVPLREDEEVVFGEFGEIVGQILEKLDSNKVYYDQLNGKNLETIQKTHEAHYEEQSDIVWDLRKIKTENEIKKLSKAAEIASKGMKRGKELIEPGKTELRIAAEIEYEMRKLGSEGVPFDTVVASGRNSCLPHAGASDKKLVEGELVTIDLGARWESYCSDMTRTFVVSPTAKQKEILQLVRNAQKAALEKVRNNIDAEMIDKKVREVFRKNNMEEYYLHGVGHGVGLDIHEPPTLSLGSDDALKENMCITIEPGLYVQSIGGCRTEDTIIVKEDGYEKLTYLS